ncbi:MAG: 4a-hydroxytetrahydrobiopterin dehydratase [Candidatus Marinimicrobia bacterium]|nr:4a-hydroxytetrahydrobiopterin dehydratase [Candidatus Neomarinimicrobiota bacterium]MCF7828826.1 4a-hydroxytetrahydrobiopterin dehydratase [Candidatus Neomarinimicrobiota bacterium]MCF7880743.1 4a-hydroxytetrahydrobiopterin dehydratase [Candidatus Neomarinimicrobiota bacterium]
MPELLNDDAIEEKLGGLNGWEQDGKKITRTFEFDDFIGSMEFVNNLVNPAETMNHHPDIEISYNTVTLSLTTHSEGGLTENDFELAGQINEIAA